MMMMMKWGENCCLYMCEILKRRRELIHQWCNRKKSQVMIAVWTWIKKKERTEKEENTKKLLSFPHLMKLNQLLMSFSVFPLVALLFCHSYTAHCWLCNFFLIHKCFSSFTQAWVALWWFFSLKDKKNPQNFP